MINCLKNTSQFYFTYLSLLGISFIFYFYQEHGDFVVFLNNLHNPIWDFWFKYWTYTGHLSFFVAATVGLILYKKRFGIILALVGMTIGGVTLLFKRVLFDQTPRPKVFFEGQRILEFVDGVNVLDIYSFPSGHAMASFGLATFFALFFQRNSYSLLLIVAATLTAISRIYLAQHFLIDIMAGSLAGVIISTAFYMAFEKYLNNEHTDNVNTPDEDLELIDLSKEDVD